MELFPVIAIVALVFQLTLKGCVHYVDAVVVNCSAGDLETLLDFKNGLNDPEDLLFSWQGRDCCLWRGIGCDENTGAVVKIDLGNSKPKNSDFTARYGFGNLSGEIRPSLLKLKSLRYLDLSFNRFGGIPIPEFFGSLKYLQYLNLSQAGFSGLIPSNLGNLSSLQYLDVSSDFFPSLSVEKFEWVSSLVSLKHLEMNQVDLSLVNLKWLDTINMLPNLIELHLSACQLSGSISSLSVVNFTSLAVLDLNTNGFDSMFPNWIVNISSLEYVDLSSCRIRGRIPLGLGELPRLRHLNLALTYNLSANCLELFQGSWKSIEFLDIAFNKLHGKLPTNIGNMTSLTSFDLSDNNIEGEVPSTIGRLCYLETLDLSGNTLTGSLPELLDGTETCVSGLIFANLSYFEVSNNNISGKIPEWLGQLKSFQYLGLDMNMIEGTVPDSLGTLQNLTSFGLSRNKLKGTLPETFGFLTKLSVLDVSHNQLTGTLSEAHFAKLSKLKFLMLSANSFFLNVSSSWIAPFQIRNLDMGSCRLGPRFPAWLQSQKEIKFLDISNASISGSIPQWFWDVSSNLSLLNVSFNQLEGQLPTPLKLAPFADVDFSFNRLSGSIPLPLVQIELLDLSNNHFNGPIPQNFSQTIPDVIFLSLSNNELAGEIPANIGEMSSLQVIDLSMNNLTGSIPSGIGNCSYLKALVLGNNNLSGRIPDSLGHLSQLQSLHLNDNMLSDELPTALKNLSSLETLDLGNNKLSGSIPSWFADSFPNIRILNLRSNAFSGSLPNEISNLSSLQVLDLAGNNLTGTVPASLGNLKAMTEEHKIINYLLYGSYRGVYFEESLVVNLKNQLQKYTKTLSLLTSIDLSGNNFYGNFPVELSKLSGLVVLNLSRNQISGEIPTSISNLRQLSSLDLSNNKLYGSIPSSMTSLTFLSYLNLSNNNFSGKVPYVGQISTFPESAFEGNPELCGAPLVFECQNEDVGNGSTVVNDKDNDFTDKWFFLSLGLGFVVGILLPYLIYAARRPWGHLYFDFVDNIVCRFTVKSSRRNRYIQ